MLGHLPSIRFLAGVALGGVLFDYVYWGFGFLRMGTTGTTAQAHGRGDRVEVARVLWRGLVVAAAIAAGLLLLQRPVRELGFWILSGEAGVEAAGRDYFDARIWAAPATLAGFVIAGWFLGREQSRHLLAMTIVANVGNVAFNYVFIVRLGWGAYGAGLGTTLSQYLMLAVAIPLLVRSGVERAGVRVGLFDRERMASMFRLNADIFVRTLCLISVFAAFVNVGASLGTAALAALTLLLRLINLASYMIDGAAFACESLAGIFRGRGDRAALRRLFRLSLVSSVGFAAGFLALVLAAREPLLGLLTDHADVVADAAADVVWLVPVLLFGALAYMYDGLFLGLTAGRTLRNSMLAASIVVFAPIAFAAQRLGSIDLLWAAMALFMAARVVTLAFAARRLRLTD